MPIPAKPANIARRNNNSRRLFWLSLALFFGSLALPAYRLDYHGRYTSHSGLEALILGPVGFFAGHFSWLANPLLWGSWFKRAGRHSGLAFVLACFALVAAASFTVTDRIAGGSAGEFPYSVGIGFHVWLTSMVAAALAALLYVEPNVVTAHVEIAPKP